VRERILGELSRGERGKEMGEESRDERREGRREESREGRRKELRDRRVESEMNTHPHSAHSGVSLLQ
jgi:hypothetical protein